MSLAGVPDVFVHLCKLDGKQATPFSFARLKAADLFAPLHNPLLDDEANAEAAARAGHTGSASQAGASHTLGGKKKKKKGKPPSAEATAAAAALAARPPFWGEYQWVTLKEDKSLDALPGRMFPGAVLLKLGLTTGEGGAATQQLWDAVDLSGLRKQTPCMVRLPRRG